MTTDRIGARVAEVRKLRGFTQRRLAADAHISLSLLTKVESGHAPATPAFVGAVARALRVDVPRLTGQPYASASATSDDIYQPIVELRRLLLAHDVALPPDAPPRDLGEIAADVEAMAVLRRAANFKKLAPVLPPLVEELRFLALTTTSLDKERALHLLAETYYGVECLGSGVGYQDVYLLAVERIAWCADKLGDPLLIAAARWGRAGPLMREGAYDVGLRLLATARDELPGSGDATLAMAGSLHLREALLAGRDGHAEEAWSHIREASDLASRVGETDVHALAFGPSNAVIYGVSVAVDLGDGVRAMEMAAGRREPLAVPPDLLGCYHIDLARGYLLIGDASAALRSLQQGRRASPQQVRHHPMVRETVLAVASRTRGSEELTSFSTWLGIK